MKLAVRQIALAMSLLFMLSALPLADAESGIPTTEQISDAAPNAQSSNANTYSRYNSGSTFAAATESILVTYKSLDVVKSSGLIPQADSQYGTVYRLDDKSTASFTVDIPRNAAYTVSLIFSNVIETAESYDFSLKIDGDYPFDECENLTVRSLWEDVGGVRELTNGDQVAPIQKQIEGFVEQAVSDKSGLVLSPYVFQLAKGTHTFTIAIKGKAFLLAGIRLNPPENIIPYSEVSADYGKYEKYEGPQIVIEAEGIQQDKGSRVAYKNSYALSPKSDNSSVNVSPNSPERTMINYIGGGNWKEPGQEIAWEFEVPADGLYKLGFAFQQNIVPNAQVYRWMRIDGKTPFAEASRVAFPYGIKWQFCSFADKEKNDYLIYLEKGKHTLSLAVTLADTAEVFERLKSVVTSLGNLYIDMVMITGDTPDVNRDYELHKQIPGFKDTLIENMEKLSRLDSEIGSTLTVNGELKGAIKNMVRILNEMSKNLYNAHLHISSYYSAYQTLSAWLYDILQMPLSIDQIILAAPDSPFVPPKAGVFEKLLFTVRRFIYSFTRSYSSVESSTDKSLPAIKIWVNWGRDQVKVLNTLIADDFTPKNKVNVKVEQVNASLVQGVISGNSPDLYLHMARTEPVNLAMRGVLYNLENFEDFDKVLENFQKGAERPYKYRGGTYALPDTQSFYVMFYRKDILARFGISVPRTWDEFIMATALLQRNNMNTYLPYTKISSATTVNTGVGGLSIFPTMMLQRGGKLYNDDQTATILDSQESLKSFTFWTDFYIRYGLNQETNFYQKFRIGTIPLGITSYTEYLTFKVTAPEIDGQWDIAEIPGEMINGVLNNSCSGSGTGCAIMKSSKNKEAAWKFIKWWVSADTQYRYSAENEAILGQTGRTASATVEAVSRLSWDSGSMEVILSQWGKVSEIPEIPGSYFVARAIDQAFWATKNGRSTPKEALIDWSYICNKEIARKMEEYANKDPNGE